MKKKFRQSVALCLALLLSLSLCMQGAYALEDTAAASSSVSTTENQEQLSDDSSVKDEQASADTDNSVPADNNASVSSGNAQVGSEDDAQNPATAETEPGGAQGNDVSQGNGDDSLANDDGSLTSNDDLSGANDMESDASQVQSSQTVEDLPEGQEPAAEEQPQDTDTETPLLSYVVVNSPELSTPDTQEILVGIGDESIMVEQATITVVNQSTGETFAYDAAELSAGAALFRISYDAGQAGTYAVESIRYAYGGVETQVVFSEIGIQAVYGVNTSVDTDPDAFVVEEDNSTSSGDEQADVVFDVSTLDDGGDQVLADSVEDALNSADLSNSISTMSLDNEKSGNVVVVLDPGHDNSHGGASTTVNGTTYKEQELTLKIAQYCKAALEAHGGITVYMTRTSNTCPNGGDAVSSTTCNAQRVAYAQSVGADYYVSIHLNSAAASASGAEVYYPNQNYRPDLSSNGQQLAQSILDQLVALGLKDRGVKIRESEDKTTYPNGSLADYYGVIRRCKEAGICGIIVEHAFLSNTSDVTNFLSSDAKLKKLGEADAAGIISYLENADIQQPTTVYNGVDYSAVYNYDYYLNRYPDLTAVYSGNPKALLEHFVLHGMSEGRQGSEEFDLTAYRNRYPDLRKAYGDDLKSYYLHYIRAGKNEGRSATNCDNMLGYLTVYNGVDYSSVYNYNYYINRYPDLKKVYAWDEYALLQHFVEHGMAEGRQGSENFDVTAYRNRYPDLRKGYGSDLKGYYLHYVRSGQKEGRSATNCDNMLGYLTVYNGVDYSSVYNYNYYINRYADLKKVYAWDEYALLQHFVEHGMAEGRQASEEFSLTYYRSNYPDLREGYGNDLKGYYLHYLRAGKAEGRVADRLLDTGDSGSGSGGSGEATAYHPIMNTNTATVNQMVSFFNSKGKTFNSSVFGMTLQQFCQIYLEEASAEGVDGLVAFSQSVLETGYFTSAKALNQFNFCGLGATDGGAAGANFNTSQYGSTTQKRVRMGIRAQIQHLKAYASKDALKNPCIDPRFNLVSRGSAVNVEDLGNGKWATDPDYASKLLNIMNQVIKF